MASSEALLPIFSFSAALLDFNLKVDRSEVTYYDHCTLVQKRNSIQLTLANTVSSVSDHIAFSAAFPSKWHSLFSSVLLQPSFFVVLQ